jgi:hypothetical protein
MTTVTTTKLLSHYENVLTNIYTNYSSDLINNTNDLINNTNYQLYNHVDNAHNLISMLYFTIIDYENVEYPLVGSVLSNIKNYGNNSNTMCLVKLFTFGWLCGYTDDDSIFGIPQMIIDLDTLKLKKLILNISEPDLMEILGDFGLIDVIYAYNLKYTDIIRNLDYDRFIYLINIYYYMKHY